MYYTNDDKNDEKNANTTKQLCCVYGSHNSDFDFVFFNICCCWLVFGVYLDDDEDEKEGE